MKKILVLIIIFICIWSILIEPNLITVKNITVHDNQLANLKVVFIGDIHYKPYDNCRLNRIINKINQQKPDLVLSCGDYIDGFDNENKIFNEEIKNALSKIQSKYGVYTVLGNHDMNIGDLGIKILNNSNYYIKEKNLYICGVEDYVTGCPNIDKAFEDTKQPRILLMHSPDLYPNVVENVNLVLAGHNHGGQVRLPFLGGVFGGDQGYFPPYEDGLHSFAAMNMIITRGLSSNPKILPRFNNLPEIVVLDFVS